MALHPFGQGDGEGQGGQTLAVPIMAIEIASPASRSDVALAFNRHAVYEILQSSVEQAGLSWDRCYQEDRGDGVLVIFPPGTHPGILPGQLAERLAAGVRAHNELAVPDRTLQLRASTTFGDVQHDRHGVFGPALNLVFRMLDAPAVKQMARELDADLVIVVSDYLMRDGLVDPAEFKSMRARVKETEFRAWLRAYAPGGSPRRVSRDRAPETDTSPTTSQLPAGPANFIGRKEELRTLDAALAGDDGRLPIVLIEGFAGVGKTALAVHWAHRVSHRFPDGHVWVNLGNTQPEEALTKILATFSVPESRIPDDLDARRVLLQEMLSGRRMLFILDDATDEAQLRHLLPVRDSPTLAIVTSRERLDVQRAARRVRLDVLSMEEGLALLDSVVGRRRTRAEPEAAEELVRRNGFLPLALQLAAGNLALYQGDRLADAVRELGEASAGGTGFDHMVRGAVDLSYRSLDDAVRRAFRLLSLVQGLDVDPRTSAALWDVDVAEAEVLLEALHRSSLVEPAVTGHYRLHPLLQEYARDRATEEEHEPTRRAAVDRYVHAVRQDVVPEASIARDFWTTEDHLSYRPYADAITAFIRHPDTQPPLTIAVKAPWGAGKTSLMRMIQHSLDPRAGDSRGRIRLTADARQRLGLLRRIRRRPRSPGSDMPVTNYELLRQAVREPEPAPAPERLEPLRAEPDPETVPPPAGWRATVWFNPWMYQNGEQVWAGLAHEIINQISSRLAVGDRERFWLRLNLARVDRHAVRRRCHRLLFERLLPLLVVWTCAVAAGICGLLVASLLPAAEHVVRWVSGTALGGGTLVLAGIAAMRIGGFFRGTVAGPLTKLVGEPDLLTGSHRMLSAQLSGSFDKLVPDPGYASRLGLLHLVQTDIRRVLDLVATPEQPLVVFVDDLDRCSPGTVAQVIEAVNLFLAGEFPNCVFVLGMEPGAVAAHVEVAYRDLSDAHERGRRPGDWSTLGWRFLEKIVQLSVSLPPPRKDIDIPGYVRTLLDVREGVPEPVASPADESSVEPPPAESADPPQADAHSVSADPAPTAAAAGPSPEPEIDQTLLAQAIRDRAPTPDTLRKAAMDAQRELIGTGEPLLPATMAAAEKVFAELYNDAAEHDAIAAALSVLSTRNPREIKRFINLFRFYTFINQLRRLHGEHAASGEQVAKLAAFAIRWPHLITQLSAYDADNPTHPLAELEACARSEKGREWAAALRRLMPTVVPSSPLPSWCYDLRDFLADGPEIGEMAAPLL